MHPKSHSTCIKRHLGAFSIDFVHFPKIQKFSIFWHFVEPPDSTTETTTENCHNLQNPSTPESRTFSKRWSTKRSRGPPLNCLRWIRIRNKKWGLTCSKKVHQMWKITLTFSKTLKIHQNFGKSRPPNKKSKIKIPQNAKNAGVWGNSFCIFS